MAALDGPGLCSLVNNTKPANIAANTAPAPISNPFETPGPPSPARLPDLGLLFIGDFDIRTFQEVKDDTG
jgi:hypothetical protein